MEEVKCCCELNLKGREVIKVIEIKWYDLTVLYC